jgi:hypothetical protein
VNGGDGLAQQQRATGPGDHRERVEATGLRRCRQQVEFQHATIRHAVMTSSVDFAAQ